LSILNSRGEGFGSPLILSFGGAIMIYVVNKRDFQGDGVYIGRPGVLGNPYAIGKDGDRDEVIEKYREWLWTRYQEKDRVYEEILRLSEIAKKRDLILVCWCKPKACHGDVIKRCLEWMMKRSE
jgi:hypothetical protein